MTSFADIEDEKEDPYRFIAQSNAMQAFKYPRALKPCLFPFKNSFWRHLDAQKHIGQDA